MIDARRTDGTVTGDICSPEPQPSESWTTLSQIPLINFLKHDPRPTFIVDLDPKHMPSIESLRPVFINPALYENNYLYDTIRGTLSRNNAQAQSCYRSFLDWIKETSLRPVSAGSQVEYGDFDWQSTLLQGRWHVLVGNPSSSRDKSRQYTATSSTAAQPPDVSLQQGSDFQLNEKSPSAPSNSHTQAPESRMGHDTTDGLIKLDDDVCSKEKSLLSPSDGDKDTLGFPTLTSDNDTNHLSHVAKRNAELLTKISALATVAIYVVDLEGNILFCNEAWYEISNHPREQTSAMTWVDMFEDDEVPRVLELWRRVAVEQKPIQFQARLKRRWNPSAAFASAPRDFPTWISAWTYPDLSSEGKPLGACGVMTDVSEQKWSEQLMVSRFTDAVERVRLSDQLEISARKVADSERRFRRLSDMMPVGIFMSDESEQVIYGNEVYFDMVPGARITQKLDWSVIMDQDIVRVKEAYRRLLQQHTDCSFEIRLASADHNSEDSAQQARWASILLYPELSLDGRITYVVGCMIDITSLKMAERIQGARAADALASKKQLEEFIDMTSHEMRNPLSAIIHSAEEILLSFQSLQPREISAVTVANTIEAAQTIIDCTEHSTRIVSDILLVSKLDSGLLDISPVVIQPVRSIKQALSMFKGEMKAADITQSFRIDESFDLLQIDYVSLDMSRVLQVFVNLITNAIKFTRPESVRQIDVCVKVSLHEPTNTTDKEGVDYLDPIYEASKAISSLSAKEARSLYITVEVTDSGCGLTEAEQKNLFQRFVQAGKRTHIKYGGTGLGLFISRQLCEMHGGRIGLRSTLQKGSTFACFVKAQEASPDQIPGDEPSPDASTCSDLRVSASNIAASVASLSAVPRDMVLTRNGSQDSVHDSQEQYTILLVEDNLINQKVVAKKLTRQGYRVIVANHGLEALDLIRASSICSNQSLEASPISLILLDVEMPVMDGLTCIQHIRKMGESGELCFHVPVVAVTANARQEQIDQAREAGMDDVITKPFRIHQLTPIIVRLMKEFPVPNEITRQG